MFLGFYIRMRIRPSPSSHFDIRPPWLRLHSKSPTISQGPTCQKSVFSVEDIRCRFLRYITERAKFSFPSSMGCRLPSVDDFSIEAISKSIQAAQLRYHAAGVGEESWNEMLMNNSTQVRGSRGSMLRFVNGHVIASRHLQAPNGVFPVSKGLLQFPQIEVGFMIGKTATISLSSFGASFGFDAFNGMFNKKSEKSSQKDTSPTKGGNCPIGRMSCSNYLPLTAKPFKPSSASINCKYPPPAFVAKNHLIPTTSQMLVMGVAANVPLGMWRQHTRTFSPSWFTAVLAGVPFVHMLNNSVSMPNTMAVTIGTCVLGQVIGGMAERHRLRAMSATPPPPPETGGRPDAAQDAFYFQLGKSSWSILVKVSSQDISITFSIQGYSFTVSYKRGWRDSSPSASLGPPL